MHICYVCERVYSSVCMCVCACPYCVFVLTVRAPLLIASSFACFLLAAERFLGGREVGIGRAPLPWTTSTFPPPCLLLSQHNSLGYTSSSFTFFFPNTHTISPFTHNAYVWFLNTFPCGGAMHAAVCTGVVTSRSPVST